MGRGVQYRKFTKSLIFSDCDNALKHPSSFEICTLSLTLLLKKCFQKFPCTTCNIGSEVAVLHPLSIERGSGPCEMPLLDQPVLLIRNTLHLVSVQIQITGDHSVNLVTSGDLICILQTVLYFTYRYFIDRSVKQPIFEISI